MPQATGPPFPARGILNKANETPVVSDPRPPASPPQLELSRYRPEQDATTLSLTVPTFPSLLPIPSVFSSSGSRSPWIYHNSPLRPWISVEYQAGVNRNPLEQVLPIAPGISTAVSHSHLFPSCFNIYIFIFSVGLRQLKKRKQQNAPEEGSAHHPRRRPRSREGHAGRTTPPTLPSTLSHQLWRPTSRQCEEQNASRCACILL
jgi:hypothetical protein